MNDDNKRRRGRRRRAGALTVAVAGFALLVAACAGGGSSTGAGAGTGQTAYQQALSYAQCMRAHGEPSFPDPNSQGQFSNIPLPSAQYQSANKTCSHLLPDQYESAAQNLQHVSQALDYAQCMRSHGIANFPDPLVAQGGKSVGFRVSGVDQSSPQYLSAAQACRHFEPRFPGGRRE